MNIDESWACYLDLVRDTLQIQGGDHFLSQFTRIHAQVLGRSHYTVRLVIAEFQFGGRLDDRWRALRASGIQGGFHAVVDKLQNCHEHPFCSERDRIPSHTTFGSW